MLVSPNGHLSVITQESGGRRRPRIGNAEDLEEVAGIAKVIVAAFNANVDSEPGVDLLHYIDTMIGQRHRSSVDSPPHVIIWLDLKKDDLDDAEIAVALAARYMLDGRIPATFDCTVDVYWRHSGQFTPMLGGGPA